MSRHFGVQSLQPEVVNSLHFTSLLLKIMKTNDCGLVNSYIPTPSSCLIRSLFQATIFLWHNLTALAIRRKTSTAKAPCFATSKFSLEEKAAVAQRACETLSRRSQTMAQINLKRFRRRLCRAAAVIKAASKRASDKLHKNQATHQGLRSSCF